jgi:hypothetical protein
MTREHKRPIASCQNSGTDRFSSGLVRWLTIYLSLLVLTSCVAAVPSRRPASPTAEVLVAPRLDPQAVVFTDQSQLGHTSYISPLYITTLLSLLLAELLHYSEMCFLGRRLDGNPSL